MSDMILDLKLTIKDGRKVKAVVSDALMAASLLEESHPEIAKLFLAIDQANDAAAERPS